MAADSTEQVRRTLRFRVTGRVQHVWFRGWAQLTARSLGVCGFVRNEPDGSVSGEAQGDVKAVARFAEALWEGPPSALVIHVETAPREGAAPYEDFVVRR